MRELFCKTLYLKIKVATEHSSQKLSEIMYSFDIDCSLMFSKYDEEKAIEEINKIYDNSHMVEILELVSESLLSECP